MPDAHRKCSAPAGLRIIATPKSKGPIERLLRFGSEKRGAENENRANHSDQRIRINDGVWKNLVKMR